MPPLFAMSPPPHIPLVDGRDDGRGQRRSMSITETATTMACLSTTATMADVDDGDGWPKSTHTLDRPPDDATAPFPPRGVVPTAMVAASVSIIRPHHRLVIAPASKGLPPMPRHRHPPCPRRHCRARVQAPSSAPPPTRHRASERAPLSALAADLSSRQRASTVLRPTADLLSCPQASTTDGHLMTEVAWIPQHVGRREQRRDVYSESAMSTAMSTQQVRRGSVTCSTPNVNVSQARHLTGEETRRWVLLW